MKEFFSIRHTLAALVFIVVWWMVAFKQPIAEEGLTSLHEDKPSAPSNIELPPLSSLKRETLHRALHGDVALMIDLIEQWELDADILTREGVEGVKRLTQEELFSAKVLARKLLSHRSAEYEAAAQQDFVVDDLGNPIPLTPSPTTLLPQTYFSAGVLLALVDPSRILCLPSGMRYHKALYPKEALAAIEKNIDATSREELLLMHPDIAIGARHYSLPSTIQTFRRMGVPVYLHGNLTSVEAVETSINALGHLSGAPLKASLLSLFMKAALNAIDNHSLVTSLSSPLIVEYHTYFSLPGNRMLIAEFLERIDSGYKREQEEWEVSISEEEILARHPKTLVIIVPDEKNIRQQLLSHPALQLLQKEGCTFRFLDEETQKTPSQYLVLAYYDLVNALK